MTKKYASLLRGDYMEKQLVNILIEYFGNDVKRIGHGMKVYSYGKAISCGLEVNEKVLYASCLFHDIGIKVGEDKGEFVTGSMQEEYGKEKVKELLANTDFTKEEINIVSQIIGEHHSYKQLGILEYQILIEADMLVNMNEHEHVGTSKEEYYRIFNTENGKRIFNLLYE